jgi:hypothetical protein
MKKTMLERVNEFLTSKKRPNIGLKDTLYSSGLLDSMEMLELSLFLQNNGDPINVPLTGTNLIFDEMDTIENLEKIRFNKD